MASPTSAPANPPAGAISEGPASKREPNVTPTMSNAWCMGVQEATERSRNDNPMPSSSATTWPTAVKSAAAAATTAVPSHQPAQTPRQRRDRRRERAEHANRAVTDSHVTGAGDRDRQHLRFDGGDQSYRDDQRGADMADGEGDEQSPAGPHELTQGQQADQPRQPEEQITAVVDERAPDQGAQLSPPEVVDVGAHSGYGDRVCVRPQRGEDEIDDEQKDRVGSRDSNRRRAGHGPQLSPAQCAVPDRGFRRHGSPAARRAS